MMSGAVFALLTYNAFAYFIVDPRICTASTPGFGRIAV
jgi:hypothetical protein